MANIIGTFVNSENFLNSLSATATNDIYVINNVALEDLATQANSQLSTIATTGNFGDLETPPTKAQLLEILELSDSGTAYTNHVDWANVDNKPNDLGGGGSGNVVIPENISAFINDIGYLTSYTETDPIFEQSPAANITLTDISNWNNKSDFDGSYTSLTDIPIIEAPIRVYDFKESTTPYLSNFTNGVLTNIQNILFTSGGTESIENYLLNLITSHGGNKLVKITSNVGQHYLTSVEHVIDENNNINYYTLNLTPVIINNYSEILTAATTDEVFNSLNNVLVYYIIILDIEYHRLVIKTLPLNQPNNNNNG